MNSPSSARNQSHHQKPRNDGRGQADRAQKFVAIWLWFVFQQISDSGTQEKIFDPRRQAGGNFHQTKLPEQRKQECRAKIDRTQRRDDDHNQVAFRVRNCRGYVFQSPFFYQETDASRQRYPEVMMKMINA